MSIGRGIHFELLHSVLADIISCWNNIKTVKNYSRRCPWTTHHFVHKSLLVRLRIKIKFITPIESTDRTRLRCHIWFFPILSYFFPLLEHITVRPNKWVFLLPCFKFTLLVWRWDCLSRLTMSRLQYLFLCKWHEIVYSVPKWNPFSLGTTSTL